MLSLSRRLGESVVIGGLNVRITVVEIDRNKVRLAFDAPKDIAIVRSELIARGHDDGKAT